LGTILEDSEQNGRRWTPRPFTGGRDLPLQEPGIHHVDGQQCVVQRAERRAVEIQRRVPVDRRRSVADDRVDQRFPV